jgi:hypothetical protein
LWITVNDLVGWSFFDFLSFFFDAFSDAGMNSLRKVKSYKSPHSIHAGEEPKCGTAALSAICNLFSEFEDGCGLEKRLRRRAALNESIVR